MSNYATLKAAIQSAVYTNNNNEITGAGLQSVLLQIVNAVGDGYLFKGVATAGTAPGTPDANVFYIAPAGTYTNFGSSYTVPVGSIGVFAWDGSWNNTAVNIVSIINALDSSRIDAALSAAKGMELSVKIGEVISGLLEKVYVNRKNLLDISASRDSLYIDSNGVEQSSGSFAISEVIPVEGGEDYYLSSKNLLPVGNVNSFGWFYKTDGTRTLFNTASPLIQVPADCYAVEFSYIKTRNEIQFEKGSSRTDYESYQPGEFTELFSLNMGKFINDTDIINPNNRFLYSPESPNLCGWYNVVVGYYVNGSGTLVANANYKTYIIPVSSGQIYQMASSEAVSPYINYYAFKDIKDQFISAGSNASSVVAPSGSQWLYASFLRTSAAQVSAGASKIPYVNGDVYMSPKIGYDIDLRLPRFIYIIGGEQHSIYHSEYCRTYNDGNVYADRNGGAWDFYKRCWRIGSSFGGGNLSFVLRDRRTDEQLYSYNIPTRVGSKAKTSTHVNVNVIGDSFCYGGYYLKQIADMCGNATFVGMRDCQRFGIKCEGRGGWSLDSYFNPKSSDVALTHMQPFSPFMHADGYNYYGVVEFWASIVNNTSQYAYGTDGFGTYESWFDSTGHKTTPSSNDLMYNTTLGKYEYWNGSAWTALNTEPTFSFDYGKYASIWQINAPDFVVIQLGTNDFFAGNAGFDLWFSRMDSVIASINNFGASVSKTINILLCTVLTASGTPNNVYGDGIIKRNKYYYEARKRIITRYDNGTAQVNNHLHVVDTGVVVDDEYGFLTEERLPFSYYEGDARELYDTNGVHPDVGGYKQFANPIAGAIQYYRS
jgi:lysophospholipase L1-like esterase